MVTIGQFYHSEEHATRERSFLLDAGPRGSGGQRISLLSPHGLDDALQRLARELSSQHSRTDARTLITPERAEVSSARAGVTMRGARARGESGARRETVDVRYRACVRLSRCWSGCATALVQGGNRHRLPERHSRRTEPTTTSPISTSRISTSSRTASSRTSRSSPGASSRSPCRFCSTAARAWKSTCRSLQQAASNFVHRLKSNDIAQVIDFDSRVEIRQTFTGNQAELDTAISVDGRWLHLASQRHLHRVERTAEGARRQRGRCSRQAPIVFSDGEDTSSLVSFDEVLDLAKRSETSIYTIALRGRRQAKGFREAEFGCARSRRKPAGARSSPQRSKILQGVQADQRRAASQTRWVIHRRTRRDGAWRRIVVQVSRPNITPRTKKGITPRQPVEPASPRSLRRRGRSIAAIHFAKREASVGRTATTLLLRACSRTPSSSACRRWRFATFRSPTRRPRCRRSSGCWRSYLYLEVTTDERAMGVFIVPILVGCKPSP